MLYISISMTITSVLSWATAVIELWECWPARVMPVTLAWAGMTGVIAALCWLFRYQVERDKSRTLLIRTLAGAVPAQPLAEVRQFPSTDRLARAH